MAEGSSVKIRGIVNVPAGDLVEALRGQQLISLETQLQGRVLLLHVLQQSLAHRCSSLSRTSQARRHGIKPQAHTQRAVAQGWEGREARATLYIGCI